MSAERDQLIQIIWDGAVDDRTKSGMNMKNVPVVRPKVEALADAILAAGFGPVKEAKAAAWDEGRESLALDFAKPMGRDGLRAATANPYRTAS